MEKCRKHEEATVYVRELDFFLTLKILEDTRAVLSLGKALRGSRISMWVAQWSKNLSHKNGVIRRTTYQSWSWVYRRLPPRQAHQHLRHHYRRKVQAQHLFQHQVKVRMQLRGGPLFSEIPEWLKEFRENLVDESVPEPHDLHASSLHEPFLEPLRQMVPGKHTVYTHLPKDGNCKICQRTNITRAPCRRRTGSVVPRAKNVGDLITADDTILSEGCESRNNHRYAVVVQDWATRFNHIRVQQKLRRTRKVLKKPSRKPKVIYTDNSLEFGNACEDLSWNQCTLTPHRLETNVLAERAARRIKENTSAVLLQSGFDEKWWADSMECYCYLRHIQDLLADGTTPHETRFGEPFKRPIIPFGSSVEYHPFPRIISQESINLERMCSLESSSDMYCTRKGIWKGDLLIVDLVELEEMNASEIHAKRLKA